MAPTTVFQRHWQRTLAGAVLLLGAASWVGADSEFPLPPGVSRLREPTQVDLGGASTLAVQSFLTRLDEPAVIAFYRKALPKAGWRLSRLPWQADQDAATERLEKAVQYRRDLPEESNTTLKTRLKDFQQTAQAMQRQIYATRGSEHVIVNLWPVGGTGIMVFINRWSGSRSWMEGDRRPSGPTTGTPSTAQAGGWPLTNVCCSGEEVPDLKGPLPFFIPRYPNARAVARSSSGNGERTTILLMAPGSADDVSTYYRTELPRDGWELVTERRGPQSDPTTAEILAYQRPGRSCVLTIQGSSGESGAHEREDGSRATQTLVRIEVGPRSFRSQL